MKKLELKHLAAYLPYGLQGIFTDLPGGMAFKAMGLTIDSDDDGDTFVRIHGTPGRWGGQVSEISNFKPILRPLSDLYHTEGFSLSKMITHGYHNTFWSKEQFSVKHVYYHDLLILLEWHFDVFGLIDVGLAINKNNID